MNCASQFTDKFTLWEIWDPLVKHKDVIIMINGHRAARWTFVRARNLISTKVADTTAPVRMFLRKLIWETVS